MKKLLNLCLVVTLMLNVIACGAKDNTSAPSSSGETVNSTVSTEENKQPEQKPETIPTAPTTQPEAKPEQQPEKTPEQPASGEAEKNETQSGQEETVEKVIAASHSDVTMKAAGSTFVLSPKGAGDRKVTYSSEDETIATVAKDGTVTAVAPGNTTIVMQVEDNGVQIGFSCIVRCHWTVETTEDTTTENQGGEAFEKPETPTEAPVKSADLAAFFTGFMESLGENAPFMMEMNGEIAEAFYPGLSAYAVKQSVMQAAAMSAVPFEFVLLELENSGDVDTVKTILKARVDAQASGGAWYPETIAAWEKAEIVVNGNYVAMIVAGDQQSNAVSAFQALFQ